MSNYLIMTRYQKREKLKIQDLEKRNKKIQKENEIF